jgi:anti-anti-sigma factor
MVRAHEWDGSRRLSRASAGRRPWWVGHPIAASALRLERESAGARTIVAVGGDIDSRTAPQLEAFVADSGLVRCAVLELELSGVASIGSVGLSTLVALHRWCAQRGVELRLRGATPSVWRVIQAGGLDRTFAGTGGSVRPCGYGEGPVQDLALF